VTAYTGDLCGACSEHKAELDRLQNRAAVNCAGFGNRLSIMRDIGWRDTGF
jgi:hypothetical protein